MYLPTNNNISALNGQIETLKGQIGDTTPLDEKLQQLNTKKETDSKRIAEIKELEKGKSINKQEFLMFLGKECNSNLVDLINFNDLGVTQTDNEIWKVQFDFELRGNMANLNKVCENINNIGVKYAVGGLSLRQNENYPYLTRFFDDISKLEWYKDPVPPLEEEKTGESIDNTAELMPDSAYFNNTILPNEKPAPTQPPQENIQNLVPAQTPFTETTPQPKSDTITERLDQLLESTSYTSHYSANSLANTNQYRVKLLASNNELSDVMRLNITIEFVMYSDPKDGGIYSGIL
jgi:hypothetical protein